MNLTDRQLHQLTTDRFFHAKRFRMRLHDLYTWVAWDAADVTDEEVRNGVRSGPFVSGSYGYVRRAIAGRHSSGRARTYV